MEHKESVALVTGEGRGLGRAVALALAGEGVHVALMGLTGTHLLIVEKEVNARGVRSAVLPGDVSDEGSVSRCVAAAEQQLGPIDVLVYSAGVYTHGPVDRLDALVFDHTIDVNLRGPFLMARAILPGNEEPPPGSRRQRRSTAARRGFAGERPTAPRSSAWPASPRRCCRTSGARRPRHCILPSTVATDMARRGDFLKDAAKAIRPEDVAQAIVGLLKLDVRVSRRPSNSGRRTRGSPRLSRGRASEDAAPAPSSTALRPLGPDDAIDPSHVARPLPRELLAHRPWRPGPSRRYRS